MLITIITNFAVGVKAYITSKKPAHQKSGITGHLHAQRIRKKLLQLKCHHGLTDAKITQGKLNIKTIPTNSLIAHNSLCTA